MSLTLRINRHVPRGVLYLIGSHGLAPYIAAHDAEDIRAFLASPQCFVPDILTPRSLRVKLSELSTAAVAADQGLATTQAALAQAKNDADARIKAVQAEEQAKVDAATSAVTTAQTTDANAWAAFVTGLNKVGGKAGITKGNGTLDIYTVDASSPLGYTVVNVPVDPDV